MAKDNLFVGLGGLRGAFFQLVAEADNGKVTSRRKATLEQMTIDADCCHLVDQQNG